MHHGCSGCSSVCACRICRKIRVVPRQHLYGGCARRCGTVRPVAFAAQHQRGQRFLSRENVSILRLLSWCCIAAGLVCLFSALYYMPFLIVSAAAAFVGLILRVVKNVFAEAVRLKDENDYTI